MKTMQLTLELDRGSFDEMKLLLEKTSMYPHYRDEPIEYRIRREALRRVFDQIRDVKYEDTPRHSLDYE